MLFRRRTYNSIPLAHTWLMLIFNVYICSVSTEILQQQHIEKQNVPLFISNNSLSAAVYHTTTTTTTTYPAFNNNQLTKVPSNAAYTQPQPQLQQQQQQQQTPASVFFANYNNQQNVLQLVRNIDTKLRNIRNVEMRVTHIQEIFDSMHYSSAASPNRNNSINERSNQNYWLQQDLQLFSKRLSKKLQKAKHVVLELRDFLRNNISKVLLQQQKQQNAAAAYNDDADEENDPDFDLELDDFESGGGGGALTANTQEDSTQMHLYLNTYIENCQPSLSTSTSTASYSENYNKQQIQILNYIKTDDDDDAIAATLNENNARSLAANTYIAEKLINLKNGLTQMDVSELLPTVANTPVQQNSKTFNHFKHIYFLSHSDAAVDVNTRSTNSHFRKLYVSAIKRKFVLLLIDVGSALNVELLELTKNFVSNVVQLLSNTDFIAIVTVAAEADFMYLDGYPQEAMHGIYAATRARKLEILSYINSLQVAKTLTNHTHGFEYAFQMLHKLYNESLLSVEQPIEFVYVTRGLLNNLSDAMHVLSVVAQGQQKLPQPILINTCAVVLDEKRIMYEKQFLSDIATQNYTKYDIEVSSWLTAYQQQKIIGKFFVLTKMHQETLVRASTGIFGQLFDERYLIDSLEVHSPVVVEENKDVIVSLTYAVYPYGVVGVNLYLADLIEDILSYQQHQTAQQNAYKHSYNYAFLIERSSGNTVAHPAYPRPSTQSQTAFPVDITYLENATDFATIRNSMLTRDHGNLSTSVYLTNNRKTLELMERTYNWQSILDIYVLCLVTTYKMPPISATLTNTSANGNDFVKKPTFQIPQNIPISLQRFTAKENIPQFAHNAYDYMSSMDLLYHRLDLLPATSTKSCRYFRQLATLETPTLFLSAAAFESPFTFLYNNRLSAQHTQVSTVETIMAYIKDTTGLIANPGLRPQIRNEVNALYNAMLHLKKRHQDARGILRNYIIRRYIATVNGVLQVYPGCLLSSNYDATRRPWFLKAMQLPGRIVTTEPYLDAGGSGYIVTIAHTIFEGKGHALHSIEQDQPVAIVALDLPYAFYYKLILESTPLCQLHNIKCLLFENEGYLIAHPSMLEPSTVLKNQRRPHEHLTHKESYLANDILNHKTLVRKLGCSNYQNRTLQRYYVFNTSLSDILTNVVHGERTKYAISLVRGSNIFAAVLNSTCDGGAFCPCSTIDRICLNCKRMDQADCECPCECPMELDASESYSNYTQQFAYCPPPSENFIALPPDTTAANNILHSCLNINCDVFATQNDCLAIMGCEWCQQDLDGNPFTSAFCASQSSCFNGVLAAFTPYGDLDDMDLIAAHGFNPQQKHNSYSAFGPVGGAIVVLVIVIGFAIYCYRNNMDNHAQDQFYIDSMQEENYGLPLSRFNFDDCQMHDDPPHGGVGGAGYEHPGAAQRNLMHPADISPYHVSTGSSYRRPPNGESDHGYSTMTPHEDSSEHQCFTLAEPLLLHDKRNSKSDTMSISTSISSPTNRHQQQQQQQQQQQTHPYLNTQPIAPVNVTNKEMRYNHHHHHHATPKKQHHHIASSPASNRVYGQTTLPLDSNEHSPHYILAPVTVHRHMDPTES